ncbi:inositol monophosphatase family protein [Streptomyces roseolilacinus]|uniref:Inositol phosphatase n=1 Tax=Streptomyces roseolilacinus TaxID=66904 RepID=A0A918AWT8_9ACTN|nr:inositol monophosphatase [Streptomyces roseolilacinus]GGP95665.1 inositol phosphatase [Streptomyces roseolilacinus]
MNEFRRLLPQVTDVAREVGEGLRERRSGIPATGPDVASVIEAFDEVDRPAVALLRERLGAVRPRAVWAPDEVGTMVGARGETWVCDAVDGAVQFLRGLPHWGVSITLVADARPVLAVLYAPQLDILYTAAEGAGARLNGRPVTTSSKTLAAALACTSQPPHNLEPERAGASLTGMLRRALVVRNLGPTSLQVAQVGSGHVDVFWEYGRDVNNLLPGSLIAREAGAVVTDAAGAPWRLDSSSFVAAAPSVHREVMEVLAAVG